MPPQHQPEQTPSDPPAFVVEVEGYEGEDGQILVENDRADGSPAFGMRDKIYCIAQLDDDGVIRFNDWGYATAAEARKALDGRIRARARPSD